MPLGRLMQVNGCYVFFEQPHSLASPDVGFGGGLHDKAFRGYSRFSRNATGRACYPFLVTRLRLSFISSTIYLGDVEYQHSP